MSDDTRLLEALRLARSERDKWKRLSRKNEDRFLTLATVLDEHGISAHQLLNDVNTTSNPNSKYRKNETKREL